MIDFLKQGYRRCCVARKRTYGFYSIVFISFSLLFLTGCGLNKAEVCDQPGLEIIGEPYFVSLISPVNQVKLSMTCYEQKGGFIGISVGGASAKINRAGPRDESVADRFELWINGTRISNETLEISADYSAVSITDETGNEIPVPIYDLIWRPDLDVGPQRIQVFITQDNGEILEYGWEFEITK